jgi:3-hydroxy-3-methylglutaryl CoA synthase
MKTNFLIIKISLFCSQLNDEQFYGRRILLFSYGSGLASSMYSITCQKVHDTRFTLAQVRKSIQQARDILDHERIEITPNLMDQLLLERETNDHKGRENFVFFNKQRIDSFRLQHLLFHHNQRKH